MEQRLLPEEHFLKLYITSEVENGEKETCSVTLICTNEALDELIIGYLYNENIISSVEDIITLSITPNKESVSVLLRCPIYLIAHEVRPSGFGGMLRITACELSVRPPSRRLSEAYIRSCAAEIDSFAVRYATTGGIHASAIFDESKMISFFEDIGRHNTLDKLCGDCLLRAIDTSDTLLVTTGRISSDMVRKAAGMGVTVIASYSTATQRAYQLAGETGITLIGYLRRDPMQIICGAERMEQG